VSTEAEYRQQVVIWLAMVVAIGLYFAILRLAQPASPTDNPLLVDILLFVALVLLGVSFAVKNVFLARGRAQNKPALRRAGPLIALVLCDTAALFGILVWFMTGSPRANWFLLIGLAGVLLHYPSRGAPGGAG
jgi:uncharacterized membrane protein